MSNKKIKEEAAKKKTNTKSHLTTIQIRKEDRAKLFELAWKISRDPKSNYDKPPAPATMVNLAVSTLERKGV